jgi:membrane-associated phospholipid phosphatase
VIRVGPGLVFGFCLLLATETLSPTCSARPQQQQSFGALPGGEESGAKIISEADAGSSNQPTDSQESWKDRDKNVELHLLKNMASDQRAALTSPFHVRLIDADWLLPLGVVAGGMFATDTEVSKHLSNSPSRLSSSNSFSNYGIAAMAGAGGSFYLWGKMTHDDHMRETGFLAGEAALDSLALTYGLKSALGRQRPLDSNYQGNFWQGGNSFPSEHAAAAWSIATVIAHEYPGPITTALAYGMASAIGAARIDAKQHFPSDVLIGSAVGWLMGQYVYRAHHDPALGGDERETYADVHDEGPGRRSTSIGSPYVELDSWIYPAIERLAAFGYIDTAFLGMRPWTRLECAHLVQDAEDTIEHRESVPSGVSQLYVTLEKEFRGDLAALDAGSERSIRLESLYAGATGIDGAPLHDSYHFGQTIINNDGRPYEEGFNAQDGFSGYGTAGRFTLYVRGEFQHAPSAPAYSLSARQAIATADQNPLQPATPFSTVNQFTLLDTYLAANLSGWDLTFGKQSLWWGPGEGGALLFSDNAEPIYMFRASRISPFSLPWVFHYLGPMKWDVFFGKLSGHDFPPRPVMHGEKISFKPTANLELGFSRTAVLGGVGRPLTLGSLWRSYTLFTSAAYEPASDNAGKRTGGFDLSYRVPFVRNWLSVYTDSLSDDDPSPLANPRRAGFNPGIYLSHFPGFSKLDFRVEAVYTDTPVAKTDGQGHSLGNQGQYIYFDSYYHDLYTNKGNILGSWIGREGTGFQGWSTYWVSPRNSIQFGYRHAKVAKDFLPDGETLNDGSVKVNWWLGNNVSVSGSLQYEKWVAPILAAGPQTNWTSSFEVTFWPKSVKW